MGPEFRITVMAKWLREKARPAAFITYESNQAFTREEHVLDATAAEISPGTVVQYAVGKYGLAVNGVEKGRVEPTALIVRGHAIVIERLLVWPTVVAVDGPDAGSDAVAETAAATAAFKAAALAYFAANDIIVRN